MNTLTREQAAEMIRTSGGTILGVEFTKRTTGEVRRMTCRTEVCRVKGDLGSGPAYDPASKGLLLVWDMAKHQYRTIPIEGITRVKCGAGWQEVV